MSRMEITPGMMISVSRDIEESIKGWDTQVAAIYSLYNELAAMWEGPAKEAFQKAYEEDHVKFMKLSEVMKEYKEAIVKMANDYTINENEVKNIMSRR